jgi:hypothetical protein
MALNRAAIVSVNGGKQSLEEGREAKRKSGTRRLYISKSPLAKRVLVIVAMLANLQKL